MRCLKCGAEGLIHRKRIPVEPRGSELPAALDHALRASPTVGLDAPHLRDGDNAGAPMEHSGRLYLEAPSTAACGAHGVGRYSACVCPMAWCQCAFIPCKCLPPTQQERCTALKVDLDNYAEENILSPIDRGGGGD